MEDAGRVDEEIPYFKVKYIFNKIIVVSKADKKKPLIANNSGVDN